MVPQSRTLVRPLLPIFKENMSLLFLMKTVIFVMIAKCINKFLCIKLWWVSPLETVEGKKNALQSGFRK